MYKIRCMIKSIFEKSLKCKNNSGFPLVLILCFCFSLVFNAENSLFTRKTNSANSSTAEQFVFIVFSSHSEEPSRFTCNRLDVVIVKVKFSQAAV